MGDFLEKYRIDFPWDNTYNQDIDGDIDGDMETTELDTSRYPANGYKLSMEMLECGIRKSWTPFRMWVSKDGLYTTVEWCDGEKTTVKAEDPEKASLYGGFTACLAKRIFGSTTDALGFMESALQEAGARSKEKARIAKLKKERKQYNHQERIRIREERIKAEMEHQRIVKLAADRLAKKEEE